MLFWKKATNQPTSSPSITMALVAVLSQIFLLIRLGESSVLTEMEKPGKTTVSVYNNLPINFYYCSKIMDRVTFNTNITANIDCVSK